TEVLVHVPLVRFWLVVLDLSFNKISSEDRCALIEVQGDVALQTNRDGEISSGWKVHHSAAGDSSCFNCFIDCRGIKSLAISFCAKCRHVIDALKFRWA